MYIKTEEVQVQILGELKKIEFANQIHTRLGLPIVVYLINNISLSIKVSITKYYQFGYICSTLNRITG